MSIAIQAENISKAYQIGEFSTGTLTKDIDRWWKLMRGKEDPYLKIGETNDRSTKGESNVVWSLKDINFEINKGDAVGIIGRNGAGKSTLLKILSRVTTPTTGSVKVKGRIASLLEVGTGFHPELTGKENIYLNGAILGMRKHEIKKHFDAIVDFSGVERYIDTPVKRYSSGMYVRLAFAVAAHLESEILIVDEVLAVGDAEFQKKCLGKMGEVSKGEGRTILFVSHNMAAIETLCNTGLVLDKGRATDYDKDIRRLINNYLKPNEVSNLKIIDKIDFCHKQMKINKIIINGEESNKVYLNRGESKLIISIEGELTNPVRNMAFGLTLFDERENKIGNFNPGFVKNKMYKIDSGSFIINESVMLPSNLTKGEFLIEIILHHPNIEMYLLISKHIKVINEGVITLSGAVLDYKDNGYLCFDLDNFNA